jgi:PAS domain S-box-containing protein
MIRVLRYSSLLNYGVGLVVACAALLLLWPGLARNLFAVGHGAETFMTHEHCYLGVAPLVRLHFLSDLLIGLSYVAISLALTYLVFRARRDIPFHWVFLAFGLFIVACASTHFMEVWTTFNAPVYWLAGYLKLITAVASVATAFVLPPLIPRTLALVREAKLSGARREELEQARRELETFYAEVRELNRRKSEQKMPGESLPQRDTTAAATDDTTAADTTAAVADAAAAVTMTATAAPSVAELSLAPLVLVVEDDQELNRFITEQLGAKYRVAGARDGREAVARAHELLPDLILSDASMPGMGGGRFVEELRAHAELARVPVCMLTAEADEEARVRLLRAGVQDYLTKPFAGEELLARVANLIETKRTREALQSELDSQHYDLTKLAGEVSSRQREMRGTLAALRESNQTLEAIIHASPLGIIALDPDAVVRMWNQSAERIYGWNEAEVLGRMLPTVPPDKLEEVRRNHRQAVAGKDFTAFETVRLRKDGTQINVSISTAPLRDAGGRINGVVALVEDITERVRAEGEKARLAAEVEAQRHRLDAIITSVPGVVWEAWGEPDEASQRINFVSDYVETLLGYTVKDWLSTPNFWLSIVHPEDHERAARTAAETFESGVVGTNEFRWVTKDGRAVWMEAHSVAIRDEAGRPAGMRGVTMDITQRKHAEEGLRRWEQIFQHAGWGVALGDPATGTLEAVNPAFARMHGSTVEEMRGTPLADTFAPEEREHLAAHVRAVNEKGHHVYESIHVRRDGTRFPVLADVTAFRDERGEVLYRAANIQDITERKRAEEAARFLGDATTMLASSLDYGLTLESVARLAVPYVADFCLVHMLEDDGSIHRMIVAHQDPAREAAWRDMQRRFPLDLDTPHTIAKVLRTGRPELFAEISDELWQAVIRDPEEIRMLREFDIKAAMIMPLAARGRTIGALTFISSESARRYGADDFALAGELARRAALAIDNARLYGRAQEANHAKDEFLATLSHELRTPLTPIIGWVHMMSGGQLAPADLTHGLAIIGKNSQSLSHLINDLLDMSAILSGKMRIDTLPVSLRSVIGEAIETVRPRAAERNIRLELAPAAAAAASPTAAAPGAEDVLVSGDRTRLVQVFWNLLTNAVKFSPAGSRVRVACEIAAEGVARVRVEDEGEGITEEFLPYVFDRFRQQDMSTTKAHGGLGIGLALVKSFVEAHGGTVVAASAGAGRGSRFTVSLPLAPQAQPAVAASDEAAEESSCEAAGARHVLIVEDAPDTLEMLRVTFEVRGFRTSVCATPEEALSIAEGGHFDIIISDIGLPKIDGYELLQLLRARAPHLRDVPALALTGYAAQKDVDAALSAGFSAHLAKPFDPATLAATVDALLNRQKSEPPGTGA